MRIYDLLNWDNFGKENIIGDLLSLKIKWKLWFLVGII